MTVAMKPAREWLYVTAGGAGWLVMAGPKTSPIIVAECTTRLEAQLICRGTRAAFDTLCMVSAESEVPE